MASKNRKKTKEERPLFTRFESSLTRVKDLIGNKEKKDNQEKDPQLLQQIETLEEKNRDLIERIKTLSGDIREKTTLIQSLLEYSPFGIMIFDSKKRVIQLNKAAEKILAINRSQAIGHHCKDFLTCYVNHGHCPILKERHVFDREEVTCKVSNKDSKPLLRSTVHIREKGEDIIIEALIDISEIKKAQETTKAASRAKDEFLAKVSHELRTPLNAIIGFSDLIKSDFEEAELSNISEYSDNIHQASYNLLHLVDELLDVSNIQMKKITVNLVDTDIPALIQQIEKIIQPISLQSQNKFTVYCPPEIGTIKVDSRHLRQILLNLLSNACKFTTGGTIFFEVTQEQIDDQKCLRFVISDSGIGMSQEQLNNIFKEFEQADNSIKRSFGGMGLGLTISQSLAQLLGGEINVESTLDIGSTFTLRIPIG